MRLIATNAIVVCALVGCGTVQVSNETTPPPAQDADLALTLATADERAEETLAAGREEGPEHHQTDMGPPPYGYWKITGDPVPNWTPAHMQGGREGPRSPLSWEPLGPRPITGEYWSGTDDATGRVVGLAPHPTDPDTCYLAAASGGIWKTVDGGLTWEPLTDELASLNHGTVAIDPNNHDTVYIGTGEYTTGSNGAGIFRSEDGGLTWEQLADADTIGSQFSGIAIDPTDSNIIHATTRDGYFRSDDYGVTWTRYKSGAASSLALNPLDPTVVYIGRHDDGIYRSTDGGNTLTRLGGGLPSSGDVDRSLVTLCAADPEVVWASFSIGSGVEGTYRSEDGGDSWSHLNATPNFAYPQAWYDMYIVASPSNANTAYCGGVSPDYATAGIIRTTNGGDSWTELHRGNNGVQTHPDHHTLAFGPDGIIWEGNDGGVWKSLDGGNNWINCNATLTLTQNYGIGENPIDNAQVLGGTQDNGSIERVDNTLEWPQVIGGDGGFCAYDFNDPNIRYTEYVYLSIQRFIGGSYAGISGPWSDDPRNFIAPFVMDPNSSTTLLGGTNRVWRTTNASTDANWSAISGSEVGGGGTLNAIAVAEGAPDTIYTGSSTGAVYVTQNASTWEDRSAGLPGGQVSDVVIDPNDPSHAFVSFRNTWGGRVYETDNYGTSWDDVTGDLPTGAGVTALAIAWNMNPEGLFIGTGAGVWSSLDGGATWVKDEHDLPNVNIGDLKIDAARNLITAGTYGRGTWRADLSGASSAFTIVLPNGAPEVLEPDVATSFEVLMVPVQEEIVPGTEMLYYSYGGGDFLSTPLDAQGGGEYLATLPAPTCNDEPRFYIQAEGDQGTIRTSPAGAPASFYEAVVGLLEITVEDDMEEEGDWIVGAPDDDATEGDWERVNPTGTAAQPEDDHTPSPGTKCWVTNGDPGSSIGEFDVDGGKTTLISPLYNLLLHDDPIISYWRWYSNDEGADPSNDVFVVQISGDDGATWSTVETVGPGGSQASGGWFYYEFHVEDVIVPSNTMRLAFIASDENSGSIIEAALDDLTIKGVVCGDSNCVGDLDGDGDTDQSDLGILLASYELNAGGDLNGDGLTNQSDLGILLADYECITE